MTAQKRKSKNKIAENDRNNEEEKSIGIRRNEEKEIINQAK